MSEEAVLPGPLLTLAALSTLGYTRDTQGPPGPDQGRSSHLRGSSGAFRASQGHTSFVLLCTRDTRTWPTLADIGRILEKVSVVIVVVYLHTNMHVHNMQHAQQTCAT